MNIAASKDILNMRRVPRRSFDSSVGILTRGNYNLGRAFQLGEGGMMIASLHDLATDSHVVVSFQMGGEIVMVRAIVRGMLQDIGHRIEGGAVVRARTIRAKGVPEGDIADDLGALERATDGAVTFGSYPWFTPEGFGLHLVARSADGEALEKAVTDLMQLVRARGAEPEEVTEPS